MKFSEIVAHLGERGFVTRKLWNGNTVLFFGMNNAPHCSIDVVHYFGAKIKRRLQDWRPNLEEIKADDWVKLPYFWNGSKDDFLPFKKKDETLKKLKQAKPKRPTMKSVREKKQ